MGRFIIPLQQAPPRRRHLRSPTSPSHFAFRIHAQQRCSTPPAAAAWLISHQALHFSSKRPISHVAQQCFTSDIVNLPRLHRGDALNKVVHFLMLRRLMPGSSGVPSKKRWIIDKNLHQSSAFTYTIFLMKTFQATTLSCTIQVNKQLDEPAGGLSLQ